MSLSPRALRRLPGADLAALALLAGLMALYFWRLWAPNPADRVAFPVGDFTDQYFPLRRFVALALAEGRVPLWNPYLYGGQPGLADPQAAALYPPALLNALLWGTRYSVRALELEVVAHLLWAAWGSYAFVRGALRLGPLPALLAAACFAFGGFLTGFPIEQVTILETAAWLPWLLLGLHGAGGGAGRRRWAWAAGAALCWGLALLAGHPQTALYLGYTALAFALLRAWQALAGRPRRGRGVAQALAPLLMPLGLGVALAAAQLLPTNAFIADSSRQALDYAFVRGGLGWEELSTLLLPNVISGTPLYVGVAALLLAPLGVAGSGQRGEKGFWLAVALASLLLAFGGSSALFDALYLGLPGLAQVRSQERVLLLWGWALALLAAWGLAALQGNGEAVRLRRYVARLLSFAPVLLMPWLLLWWGHAFLFARATFLPEVLLAYEKGYSFLLLLLALGGALLAWRSRGSAAARRAAPPLLLALLCFDLFSVTRPFHIGGPPEAALRPQTSVVEALQAANAGERIAVVGVPIPRDNDGLRWQLPLLAGNEPLRLAATERVLATVPPWQQLQLFAAQFLVADRDLAAESPDAYEALASDGTSFAVRVRPAMPYAWLVGEAEAVPDAVALAAHLADPAWQPARRALVAQPLPALGAPSGAAVAVEERQPGAARLRALNPASAPLLLLVAEADARGWRATLDGQPLPTLRANGWALAALIPPGEHQIVLRYEPPGWRVGLAVSGGALLIVLLMVVWGGSDARRAR